jgi:tetratricopeptide (TPR) repeat protein
MMTALSACNQSRPTSVRKPLKILATPFTADKLAILQMLRGRKFQDLDERLKSYQQAFEKDPLAEPNVILAFDAFSCPDPSLGALLDEWVKLSPQSYAAQMARAKYLFEAGWRARGDGFVSGTTSQQLAKMGAYFNQGAPAAIAAIKLNPKLSIAYANLILAVRSGSDDKTEQTILLSGLKQVPDSFAIRAAHMDALLPRWGGSYEQMAAFAEESQAYVKQNPRMRFFNGFVDWDRGRAFYADGKYAQAIDLYNRAVDEGGDDSRFYESRAGAYLQLEMYDDALEDANRANQLRPQNIGAMWTLASAYANLNRPKDTLSVITLYRQFATPDDYLIKLEQLSQSAVNSSKKSASASGD